MAADEPSPLRATGFRRDGSRWVADVAAGRGPGRIQLAVREGDRLAGGRVVHVSELGLFVEAGFPPQGGGEPVRATVRYLPPRVPPAITLGRDTTYITTPVLADGTPDFGAWLDARSPVPVTSPDNAVPRLAAAAERLTGGPLHFWDGVTAPDAALASAIVREPWTPPQCPACVTRLEASEAALQAAAQAARLPFRIVRKGGGGRLPLQATSFAAESRIASALLGRGMLHLGRRDPASAARDAITIQRLATLCAQEPSLYGQFGAARVRQIGAPLLARLAGAAELDASVLHALRGELARLTPLPAPAEVVDVGERAIALDHLLRLRHLIAEGGGALALEAWTGWPDDASPASRPALAVLAGADVDWDEALRQTNRHFDLLVAVMRAGPGPERQRAEQARQAAIREAQEQLGALLAELTRSDDPRERTRALDAMAASPDGRRRLALLWSEPPQPILAAFVEQVEAEFQVAQIGLALAAERLESGRLPDRLESLGPLARAASPRHLLRYQRRAGSWAVAAVPREREGRGYCLDSSGVLRLVVDGSPEPIVDGACDPSLRRER